MYKDNKYYNAGDNSFQRYGKKAQEYIQASLEPNDNGYYTIAADGGKYWTFGTSDGKFGTFAKFGDTCFSVNKAGYIWAKAGTDKAEKFVEAMKAVLARMIEENEARFCNDEE